MFQLLYFANSLDFRNYFLYLKVFILYLQHSFPCWLVGGQFLQKCRCLPRVPPSHQGILLGLLSGTSPVLFLQDREWKVLLPTIPVPKSTEQKCFSVADAPSTLSTSHGSQTLSVGRGLDSQPLDPVVMATLGLLSSVLCFHHPRGHIG